MTAQTITPNDDATAPCDNYGAVSDRAGPGCDHQDQLDHLDTMLHEIIKRIAVLDPLVPLIPRALALLDPGAAMRRVFPGRTKRALQERETAPVPVGPAPADSPEVGP